MVDATVDAPPYKGPGAILSLTAEEAKRAGYADAIELTLPEALRFAGLDQLPRRTARYTLAEEVARFATSPAISGLLLTLGFMGITIEMLTLHGIAGFVGVGSLALFFGTYVYAGFSNSLVIALAILGIAGILVELHVFPGHFVAGVIGTLALLAAAGRYARLRPALGRRNAHDVHDAQAPLRSRPSHRPRRSRPHPPDGPPLRR